MQGEVARKTMERTQCNKKRPHRVYHGVAWDVDANREPSTSFRWVFSIQGNTFARMKDSLAYPLNLNILKKQSSCQES